ncbi:uncharacterized protein LOC128228655 [Mya arenaria]|nr:uncharacterized protein LOC128228655 [Mya arenaria]
MAKLLPNQGTLLQNDVVKLIHDQVLSLCQSQYNFVNSLEIDGIICISVLDSKEQQVVKIHKTLTSVSGAAQPKKPAENVKSKIVAQYLERKTEPEKVPNNADNYQDDISSLDELLRQTTQNLFQFNKDNTVVKNKRKRKQPMKQSPKENETRNEIEIFFNDDKVKQSKESGMPESHEENGVRAPGVNPFIHPDAAPSQSMLVVNSAINETVDTDTKVVDKESKETDTIIAGNVTPVTPLVKVKDEPVDPDYDKSEHGQDSSESVTHLNIPEEKTRNEVQTGDSVSSYNSRLIDKIVTRNEGESADQKSDITDNNAAESNRLHSESPMVMVKVEKDDTHEFGNSHSNNDTGDEIDETDKTKFENEQQTIKDPYFASLFGLQSTSSGQVTSNTGVVPYKRTRRKKNNRATDENTWIEMVKNNVTKYQAALNRSGRSTSAVNIHKLSLNESASPSSTQISSPILSSTLSSPVHASRNSNIVSLLNTPPMVNASPMMTNTSLVSPRVGALKEQEMNNGRPKRSSSVPMETPAVPQRSKSLSPTPVVKIEVDDTHHDYGGERIVDQSGFEQQTSTSRESSIEKHFGKLESKYPALFNQLQVPQTSSSPSGGATGEQTDSLLNRLPFISFQEIFNTGSPGSLPKLSEAQTMELLQKARQCPPFPPRGSKKTKSRWNWKKRQVRDKIFASASDDVHTSGNKMAKKTGKSQSDSDNEWVPGALSDGSNSSQVYDQNLDTPSKSRPSRGKKPRYNFAEVDNSDIEMDDDTSIELVSAYCSKNCGTMFTNLQDLNNHEEYCKGEFSLFQALTGNGEKINIPLQSDTAAAPSSGVNEFKCEFCGLDFNQEYRLQYHKIKVHGVQAPKTKLFR